VALLLVTALAAALPLTSLAAGSGYARAAAVVRSHGYLPNDSSEWTPGSPLSALTATARASADGYAQRAFFFVRGRYVGTDARGPSAQVREVWSAGDTVALLYLLYRSRDPLCCPTGGGSIVRFHWNGRRLAPLDRIPPASGALHR
jgi:hypothetical protein